MNVPKHFKVMILTGLLAAGCSSLPGLQVLTGDTPTDNADVIISNIDLVMADKTGATDPSLMAAADRIETAAGNVDIIEIRADEATDRFVVNLLVPPPAANSADANIDFHSNVRRAIELTWQGIMDESIGTDTLEINVLYTQSYTSLDSGRSALGFIAVNSEIDRSEAIAYLASSRTINNFIDLIIDGTLIYEVVLDQGQLYQGEPNHPMFLMPG